MRTIAVIDDNPSMLKGLDRLLSTHGFRVHTFWPLGMRAPLMRDSVSCGFN